MKIASSLVDAAYRQKLDRLLPPQKEARRRDVGNGNHNKVSVEDRVSLSTGVSLERIQSLLQTEIGKKVDAMFRDAGIDAETTAGLDWSPEATSERIFDMTTGLFGVWREQHKEMSEAELIDSFENVIRTSVDKGADQAIALIGEAGFGEQTRDVTDKTMTRLHEKYDDYFAGLRESLNSSEADQDLH